MIISARAITLTILRLSTKHEILNKVIIMLRLLIFRLRFLPHHIREQIAASWHRREFQKPKVSVGVCFFNQLMQFSELIHIIINRTLRTINATAQQLQVRLHRDSAPEENGLILLPKKLINILTRTIEETFALLLILRLCREAQIHIGCLARDITPYIIILFRAFRIQVREQSLINLTRALKVLCHNENLPILITRLTMERTQFFRGFRILLEELAIDLLAVRLASAHKVIVGDFQTRRPELGTIPVGERGNLLLCLFKLVQTK